jgi:hypothetical protein
MNNINWTDSARAALDQYLARHRTACAASGADPDEVTADLRRHIDAELAKAGLTLVTQEDLERVLARLGPPPPAAATPAATNLPAPNIFQRFRRRTELGWLIFSGVLLPVATLLIELVTHMCAGFFDPIPTWLHVLAIAFVPTANAYALFALRRATPERFLLAARLNAVAVGIALFYALCFAPLTPFACIGILFFGIGLLPLSPLLSLLVALRLRRKLRKGAILGVSLPRVWSGLAAGFALLVALEMPGVFTAWAVRAVGDDSADNSGRAVQLLRIFGSQSRLLNGCYENTWSQDARAGILNDLFGHVSPTDYQLAYYRVTGRPFNALLDLLASSPDLAPLPRLGALADDLGRALRQWRGGDPVAVRGLLPATNAPPTGADALSPVFAGHLARLWAADEVTHLRDAGPARRADAVALAVRAQLVTPVSGAVVLETKQQYDAAGLKPVDPATTPNVPVVPEPATVALLAGAVVFLTAFVIRSRRKLGTA